MDRNQNPENEQSREGISPNIVRLSEDEIRAIEEGIKDFEEGCYSDFDDFLKTME